MKKLVSLLVAACFALVLLPAAAFALDVDLIADGGSVSTAFDVGDLTVVDDATSLTVTYSIDSPWVLGETHLYVGTSFPSKSAPGRFPYKEAGDSYVVSFSEIGASPGDTIYIAAQAEVENPDELVWDPDAEMWVPREETAWAEGDPLMGGQKGKAKNWAMYFEYTTGD